VIVVLQDKKENQAEAWVRDMVEAEKYAEAIECVIIDIKD